MRFSLAKQIRHLFKSLDIRLSLLLFATVWGVYLTTAATFPIGYGDADELTMISYLGGIAHPPGYPLWIFLLYLATHAPIPLSIAAKAHTLASFFQAASIVFVFLSCKTALILAYPNSRKSIVYLASLIASMTLAFSYLYWLYAGIAEVFALNNFFAATILFVSLLIFRLHHRRQISSRHWQILGVLAGLALAHHQTIITLIPGMAVLLFPTHKFRQFYSRTSPFLLLILYAAMSFLLSYSLMFLYVYNASELPVSWRFTPSLIGFFDFITRKDFSGAMVEAGIIKNAYLLDINLAQSWQTLVHYFSVSLIQHIGVTSLLVSLIGFCSAFMLRTKRLFFSLLLSYLLAGPFLAFYLPIPLGDIDPTEYFAGRAITERMYLLGHLSLALPLAFGFYTISRWLVEYCTQFWKFSQPSQGYRMAIITVGSFLFLIPGSLMFQNYSGVNLRNQHYSQTFISDSLSSLPPNTVLICFSDFTCFGGLYQQIINGVRPDITIIPVTPQLRDQYLHQFHPQLQLLQYPDNPFRLGDVISWQLHQQHPVAVSEISEFYINYLGLEGSVSYLQPGKYFHQLSCHAPQVSTTSEYELSQALSVHSRDRRDSFHWVLRGLLMQAHLINGTLYARMGEKLPAAQEFTDALQLIPEHPSVQDRLASLSSYSGDPRYLQRRDCQSPAELIAIAFTCKQQGDQECYYRFSYQATLADPTNVQARLLLAQAYLESGVPELAKREYRHVLTLDPTNNIAMTQLNNLRSIPDLQ